MSFLIVTAYIENAPETLQDRIVNGAPVCLAFGYDDMVEVTMCSTIGSD